MDVDRTLTKKCVGRVGVMWNINELRLFTEEAFLNFHKYADDESRGDLVRTVMSQSVLIEEKRDIYCFLRRFSSSSSFSVFADFEGEPIIFKFEEIKES